MAPVLLAGTLATVYVLVSPPSLDLAAHLLRAKLFRTQGFGLWSNWWYAGHHIPGYSVLFPAAAAALTPQLAAAIAATGSAALFEPWVRERFGPEAWLGALWFAAATATDLFTGRLAFAFGLLPALGAAWALTRSHAWLACGLGALTALCSPVAALFVALVGTAHWVGALLRPDRGRPVAGIALAGASLAPIGLLAIAFPEGGTEPFTIATLWPIGLIALVALWALPPRARALRAGVVLYALGCIAAFVVPTPVGSNAARLGALVAGPLAALLWWPRRRVLLAAAALPLIYVQWQAPVRDVRTASGDPSSSSAYYRPLLQYLARQGGPPFRVEIPFTLFHWEAYEVAPHFPIARGWERQLDIADNHLFYGGHLTAPAYAAWLHRLGVRFVATSDARLDYSARAEAALIKRGVPGLDLRARAGHWRVYAVRDPTPIAQGAAELRSIGPSSLTLEALRPGTALVRVRFTPYWALAQGSGCVSPAVSPAGDFVRLTLQRAGTVKLVIRFSAARIGARSRRCR